MSLDAIHPLETAPISHSEYCPAETTITRGVQRLLLDPTLKRHKTAEEQSQKVSFAVIINHNEEQAQNCLSLHLWRRAGK